MKESQIVDFPVAELLIAVFLLAAIALYSIDSIKRRDAEKSWHAKAEAVKATNVEQLEKLFEQWKETVVLKDGTVEQWSGASSELLFIESNAECTLHQGRYWFPCWTIWARTGDTHRYFTVLVQIDVDDGVRLVAEERHSDVDVQHVIERALSLGREDALDKVRVLRRKA